MPANKVPGKTDTKKVLNHQCQCKAVHRATVYFMWSTYILGTAVAQWLRHCATNRKFAGSIPAGVSELFIDIKSFRSHYGPGVDSASNRNEYQEYFLGKRRPVRKADNLHHPVPLSRNLITLTSLKPLGLSRPTMGLLYLYLYLYLISKCDITWHVEVCIHQARKGSPVNICWITIIWCPLILSLCL